MRVRHRGFRGRDLECFVRGVAAEHQFVSSFLSSVILRHACGPHSGFGFRVQTTPELRVRSSLGTRHGGSTTKLTPGSVLLN